MKTQSPFRRLPSGLLPVLALVLGLALLFVVNPAQAQIPGTMSGKIIDENGQGIEGLDIVITDPEAANFKQVVTSTKGGRYRILLNSLPKYEFQFKKAGFQGMTLSGVKIPAKKTTRRDFTVKSEDAAMATAVASGDVNPDTIAKGGAMTTYNKGVKALNEGQTEAAIEAFEAAIEKKPDLGDAHAALARAYREVGNHEAAVIAAEEALVLESGGADMHQVLFDGYSALGQTAQAEKHLAQLTTGDPSKASKNLYNQAADQFNAGDMDGAKSNLTKVLQVDPEHPKANYMMGIVLSGTDPGQAKAHFEKFLQLAPNDPDASTASEMLKYL